MRTIDASADRGAFYAAYDRDGNGVITQAEAGAGLAFNTANPGEASIYDRDFQAATGPQETFSKGISFFVQDEISFNRLTFNVGLRSERWEHFATTGENIYTFPWEFAPRLSAAYDVFGNGKHKASAFWGRYYDPVRNNMTNFAGTLTGSIIEEQVFVTALNKFVTYRTRGGPAVQDAFFSPTTQTPYTDDLQFGYAVDLGNNMSFDAVYFNRKTRDILEDYDLELYADPNGYPGPTNDPNSLFLGYDYFGYTENPGSNFVIGTLAGGKRDFNGLEFVFRKRFADRWQALMSYNWNDAKGNTNSDSNADFQGDVDYLDPRAPNQFGTQPGLIRHLLKGAASLPVRLRPATGRHVQLELGHGGQPHRPLVGPQPAGPRAGGAGVRLRRLRQPLAGGGLGRLADQSGVGPDRSARPVQPAAHRQRVGGVLRRSVQRPEQPERGPRTGPRGWAGRERVRRGDPLGEPAPRVPRRTRQVLKG